MLFFEKIWNPNPYVGYVQLRAFISYLRNKASWVEALKIFKHNSESILWVRGEYYILVEVTEEHQQLASFLDEVENISKNK